MNMSQELYLKELNRQIENCKMELKALTNDYQACADEVCKGQIRTLLEKKEYNLLDLLKRRKEYGDIN